MYKFLFLILLTISCTVYAQTSTDSIDRAILQKYKTLVKSDSAQNVKILKMENGIQNFYIQNTKGQGFMYGGMALFYAGYVFAQATDNENYLILALAGGILSIYGTVVQIDSYKHLNIKKNTNSIKPKPKVPATYEW